MSKPVLPAILLLLAAGCGAPEGDSAEEVDAIAAGAVRLPDGVALQLPIAGGHVARLHAAYSPSGGSSLHAGTQRTCCANDYYALDIVYDDAPSSGLGEPVVAPLAGVVVKSGWANAGWANYGRRVILRHELGDGHTYDTLYAHLSEIDAAVTEGAAVEAGQRLGALGRSCQGASQCASFSTPHLHFAMHRDSSIGGSGSGGSYGGHAVIPEPLEGARDLVRGLRLVSSNGTGMPPEAPPPPPFCADKLSGLWCDGNALVRCASHAESSRSACANGCQSMPVGTNDRCR